MACHDQDWQRRRAPLIVFVDGSTRTDKRPSKSSYDGNPALVRSRVERLRRVCYASYRLAAHIQFSGGPWRGLVRHLDRPEEGTRTAAITASRPGRHRRFTTPRVDGIRISAGAVAGRGSGAARCGRVRTCCCFTRQQAQDFVSGRSEDACRRWCAIRRADAQRPRCCRSRPPPRLRLQYRRPRRCRPATRR